MNPRIARVLATATGLGLAVAPITPAVAAPTFGSGATTNTVVLQLLDQLTLELAGTTSSLESLPVGDAAGVALKVADQTFGATSARSTGGAEQEPASGEGCAVPDLGILGLNLGALCSVSQAAADPLPFGHATTVISETSVNGALLADLVDAIVELLVDTLGVSLDEAVATLAGAAGPVLEPLIAQLEGACVALIEAGDPAIGVINDVVDTVGSLLPGEVQDELAPIQETITGLDPCETLAGLLTDLPSIGSILDLLADALRDALSALDLLHVAVGKTFSDSTTAVDSITSEASIVGLSLSTLSLADVQHVLDAVVDGIVNALLTELGIVSVDLLPSASDIVGILDGLLPTGLILSDDPILDLEVTPSSATAQLDRATGETSSAGAAPLAIIDLSDTLAILLGEMTRVEVGAGMEPVVLLEGTPLETRLAVGEVTTWEDVVDGMPVAGATARSVDLVIGAGLPGGGVQLVGGDSTAQVTGIDATPAQPTDTPNLPRTGGGLAFLGLLALAGVGMRRR
jgi:hypothetical protein